MREKSPGAQEVGISLEGGGSRVGSMRSAGCACLAELGASGRCVEDTEAYNDARPVAGLS